MRIAYIVAGAGGMYCGACARDINLLRGLTKRGHDVEVVPLYTPLHIDYEPMSGSSPIFYGGINVYLQQVSTVFRHTPAAFDRILDNPALLNWVSKFAIKTHAEQLGPMTVSVLGGKHGRQKKELSRLLDYLQGRPRPDAITITNSLLSGIAPELKERLGLPVICMLQGEDGFVGVMPEPYRSKAQSLMRDNCRNIDMFISPGQGYAARMSDFLAVPADRIRVIHAGIDFPTYRHTNPRHRNPFSIGYLSVITPAKGLDILVDAFIALVRTQGRDVRLRVAGKVLDRGYWSSLVSGLTKAGLSSRFEYVGEVDPAGKVEFLRSCSVFSMPSRIEESRGMAVMEAMAAGVPVVAPHTGIFPEMLSDTEAGVLFPPGDSDALAAAIMQLMDYPDRADTIGRLGAARIENSYSAEQMAEQTLAAYRLLLE